MEQEKSPANTQISNQTQVSNAPSSPPIQEKNHSSFAIPCAIATIIAICGVSFGVYGMFFHQNPDCVTNCQTSPSTSQTTPSNTGQTAPTVSEVKDLLAQKYGLFETTHLLCGGSTILYDGFSEEDRVKLIIGEIMTEIYKKDDNPVGENKLTLSYDSLNTTYKKYFGNDSNLEKKSYQRIDILGVRSVSYLSDDDSFEVNYVIGTGCPPSFREQIVNVADVEATEKGFDAIVVATTLDRGEIAQYFEKGGGPESYYKTETLRLSFVSEDGEYKLISVQEK